MTLLGRDELLALPPVAPARTFRYGPHPAQVADLYLPDAPARRSDSPPDSPPDSPSGSPSSPLPVALLLHGGCWRARVDRTYMGQFARALTRLGVAAWNLEYRRLGDGGGWPATFEDVAAGADALHRAAAEHAREGGRPLDPTRVVAVGHSAGGHLALWLAARRFLPPGAPGAPPPDASPTGASPTAPLPLTGVLALAALPDLEEAERRGLCGGAPGELLAGAPVGGERLDGGPDGPVPSLASPAALPPPPIPQRHLVGESDPIVPPAYLRHCLEPLRARGADCELRVLPDCGHFEPVVAGSSAWPAVRAALEALLFPGGSPGATPPESTAATAARTAPSPPDANAPKSDRDPPKGWS